MTPNAVMFDPNLSHPLVIEKGAEEFGMIAQMETIMSASIYHDIAAMESLRKRKLVLLLNQLAAFGFGCSTSCCIFIS